ncbi:related to integral membrane protein pth11 [Phialocephala subalpina]|uniref:Related to integral membrane protein pth11 n=1 Tax=Phialocephala subalpina TaxID=576137 RepID=A0A1L7XUU3_9HELO|nr:related to integral membrane protein pth11 [Phialocephala subalpina]
MDDLGGYGPIIIVTLWTETAIALIFMCMRLWTRIKINRVVGWDDYLISFSCIMLIPYATAVTLAALKGLGRHSSELTLDHFIYIVRAEVIGQTFGIVGIATSKASVAAFLLRITIVNWHKWVLYIVLLSVSTSCFLCALFDYIRCEPIESIWNPTIESKCWMSAGGFTTLSLVVGVISAAADFVLAILPWFILWNLQMKRKEKTLIASSMSLGLFIIRTSTLERIAGGTDYSYETVGLILWNSTELTVTILCATIPTLRPLYKQILRHASKSKDRRQSYRLGDGPPKNEASQSTRYTSKASVVGGQRDIDDRSDKSIFGHRGDVSNGNIVCTDVVYIEFEERSEPHTPSSWSKRGCKNWEMV